MASLLLYYGLKNTNEPLTQEEKMVDIYKQKGLCIPPPTHPFSEDSGTTPEVI